MAARRNARLDWFRCPTAQGGMRASSIVKSNEFSKRQPQVPLVEVWPKLSRGSDCTRAAIRERGPARHRLERAAIQSGEQHAEAQLLAARNCGSDSCRAVGLCCVIVARAALDDSQLDAGRQVRPAWALREWTARGLTASPPGDSTMVTPCDESAPQPTGNTEDDSRISR